VVTFLHFLVLELHCTQYRFSCDTGFLPDEAYWASWTTTQTNDAAECTTFSRQKRMLLDSLTVRVLSFRTRTMQPASTRHQTLLVSASSNSCLFHVVVPRRVKTPWHAWLVVPTQTRLFLLTYPSRSLPRDETMTRVL